MSSAHKDLVSLLSKRLPHLCYEHLLALLGPSKRERCMKEGYFQSTQFLISRSAYSRWRLPLLLGVTAANVSTVVLESLCISRMLG